MHICTTKEELLEKLNTDGGVYAMFWTELDGGETFTSSFSGKPCLYWAYSDVLNLSETPETWLRRRGADNDYTTVQHWGGQKQPLTFDVCGHTCHINMEKTLVDICSFEHTENRLNTSRKEYREAIIERGKQYLVSGYFRLRKDGDIELVTLISTFQARIADHKGFKFRTSAASYAQARARFIKLLPAILIIGFVLFILWARSLPTA